MSQNNISDVRTIGDAAPKQRTNELLPGHLPSGKLQRGDLLGFFTHPGTMSDYLSFVKHCIDTKQQSTIFYHNLHTLYVYFKSAEYSKTFRDRKVIVDGMGVLFLYKLARFRLSRDYRLTYVDFIIPMMELARDQGWRVYHIGQESEVLETALTTIREKVPGIQIAGQDGYFNLTDSSTDSQRVVEAVNNFSTDLLLVGLGTPKQEIWIDSNREKINASVVMPCGSCMEYVAGNQKTAPRWMGRIGLEWLFRVCDNPKRLAFRYLIQPFLLISILLRNGLRSRNDSHQR